MPPDQVLDRLRPQMPTGIALASALELPPGAKARVTAMVFEARVPHDIELSQGSVERLLARDAIVVERVTPKRRRTVDLRPALASMSLAGHRVRFELRVGAEYTPKPTEIVAALLADKASAAARTRLRRTSLELVISSTSRPQGA